ncbi:hypothetical protein KY289_013561 [Solanum tuberosum]|nr:hypothetical protein KY289_013561 [Solanum tuberosum]
MNSMALRVNTKHVVKCDIQLIMESNSFDTAIDLAVPTLKLKRFPLLDHYKQEQPQPL